MCARSHSGSSGSPFWNDGALQTPCSVPSRGRAVVAHEVDDQRVLGLAEVLDGVQHPADLGVGVGEEAGVDLHQPRGHRLVAIGVVVPGRDLLRARREQRAGRDDAQLQLARVGLLAQRSQPSSNRPRNRSIHSGQTWCGACVAPGEK